MRHIYRIEHEMYYKVIDIVSFKPKFQVLTKDPRFNVSDLRKKGFYVITSDEDDKQSLFVWIMQYDQLMEFLNLKKSQAWNTEYLKDSILRVEGFGQCGPIAAYSNHS